MRCTVLLLNRESRSFLLAPCVADEGANHTWVVRGRVYMLNRFVERAITSHYMCVFKSKQRKDPREIYYECDIFVATIEKLQSCTIITELLWPLSYDEPAETCSSFKNYFSTSKLELYWTSDRWLGKIRKETLSVSKRKIFLIIVRRTKKIGSWENCVCTN